MAKNLTTRYLYKLFAGISGTTQDASIDALIDPVSEAIAKFCKRTFELTTYKEWFDGTGTAYLLLPQYPITATYGVSLSRKCVGTLSFAGGSWASVTVLNGVLTLQSISTAGAETTTPLTLATYPTIALLEAAVEAVSGWSFSTQSGESTSFSELIKPVFGEWALDPDDADLEIPDESDRIRVEPESNQSLRVIGRHVFTLGSSNIFVWYKAGYTLPVDDSGHTGLDTDGNVPDDLTMACNQALKTVLDGVQVDSNMKSEKFTNYAYSLQDMKGTSAIDSAVMSQSSLLTKHQSMRLM